MLRQDEKFNWSAPIRGLIALIVFVAIMVLFTAPAYAGTYSVYSCKGPANEALGSDGWVEEAVIAQPNNYLYTGTCATTGPTVALHPATGYSPGARGALVFRAPADTTISDFALTRELLIGFTGSASGTYSSVVREKNESTSVTVGCVQRSADCEYGVVAPETVTPNLVDPTEVSLDVSCNSVTCPETNGDVEVRATLKSSRFDLLDSNTPQIEGVTGSLLAGPAGPGSRSLIVSASDLGGGVRRISLSIDGGAPDVHETGGDCQEPFAVPRPCPLNLTSAFSVDTALLSAGVHSAIVTVEDASGSEASSTPFQFTVLPGSDPPSVGPGPLFTNGVPAVERPQLSLSQARIESMRGGSTIVTGTLRTPEGTPIAGATIVPVVIDLGNAEAPESTLPTVVTAADGTFSFPVEASGAKKIRISFRPNPGAAETAIATIVVRQALALSVKRSKSRVKPRGKIVISGVLTGAGSATNDAPVEINALVKGKWRAVGVVEANAKGKYRWSYRFVSVRRATTFKFRALVRRSAAWPWPTEVGRTISVRVAR